MAFLNGCRDCRAIEATPSALYAESVKLRWRRLWLCVHGAAQAPALATVLTPSDLDGPFLTGSNRLKSRVARTRHDGEMSPRSATTSRPIPHQNGVSSATPIHVLRSTANKTSPASRECAVSSARVPPESRRSRPPRGGPPGTRQGRSNARARQPPVSLWPWPPSFRQHP